MAKITPVDTGWFAGNDGKIADENSDWSGWQLSSDGRIAQLFVQFGGKKMQKPDPYYAGYTIDSNRRICCRGRDTGFFFSDNLSIMQDDDNPWGGSIASNFRRHG